MNLINEVKKKKELRYLPDSIVKRALNRTHNNVKDSRALLRKYFGVFLTNRVLKGKGSIEEILKTHISSKKRNYESIYREIFKITGIVGSVIDLGAGVNGFSYKYLREFAGPVEYIGIEASGQLVDQMNNYFKNEGLETSCKGFHLDLFNISEIKKILRKSTKKRLVFMFQVIDALENLEKNFSKEFIIEIAKESEIIVLTLSTTSLSGRKKFQVKRTWITRFLEENFNIKRDFNLNGERIIIFDKK